jgi:hypothetical protein
LYIAYYNRYPLNSEQIGDILIKSVNYDDINPDQSSAVHSCERIFEQINKFQRSAYPILFLIMLKHFVNLLMQIKLLWMMKLQMHHYLAREF